MFDADLIGAQNASPWDWLEDHNREVMARREAKKIVDRLNEAMEKIGDSPDSPF